MKPADKHYEIKYRCSDYTFPTEAAVTRLSFDDTYMHMAMGASCRFH